MKLYKDVQYAILFCLYLNRAGRATVDSTAKSLGISSEFLHKIAAVLKKAGVVRSIRGPGGGFELIGAPTVADVQAAIRPYKALSHLGRGPEYRALRNIELHLRISFTKSARITLKDADQTTVQQELFVLDSVSEKVGN